MEGESIAMQEEIKSRGKKRSKEVEEVVSAMLKSER
jgi:hypothetical protein